MWTAPSPGISPCIPQSAPSSPYDLLRHPLLIFALTVLISGIVLPRLSLRIQNQQKAHESKTQLSQSLFEWLVNTLTFASKTELTRAPDRTAFVEKRYELDIRGASITAQISATLLPDQELSTHWERVKNLAFQILGLAIVREAPARSELLQEMQQNLSLDASLWAALIDEADTWNDPEKFRAYSKSWLALSSLVMGHAAELQISLMKAKTKAYG